MSLDCGQMGGSQKTDILTEHISMGNDRDRKVCRQGKEKCSGSSVQTACLIKTLELTLKV